jgi:spore coat polysaccharide biosynthesis predicted glycosyltransferase SpsG
MRAQGWECHALQSDRVGSQDDARQTLERVRQSGAVWVCLDAYAFDEGYQRAFEGAPCRVLVVDDHGHAPAWHAHVILHVGWSRMRGDYLNGVEGWDFLSGPQYALLRREFRDWKPRPARVRQEADLLRLLLSFGGSDPSGLSIQVLEHLLRWRQDGLRVELRVLIGDQHELRHASSPLEHLHREWVEFVRAPQSVLPHFEWADAVVGAVGGTVWEWLYCGLPMAVLPVALNQLPLFEELCRREWVCPVGDWTDGLVQLDAQALRAWIDQQVEGVGGRTFLSAGARVDGLGAIRVCQAMLAHLNGQ